MEWMTWLTYVGVITALIAFPGPVALLCASHGLKHGHRRALSTVLGGAVAAMIMMTASALGLGAILAASETAFLVLKFVGGAYLIFLGIQSWRAPAEAPQWDVNAVPTGTEKRSHWQLFRVGFTVGISNPKDLLFFAALFPGFIALDQPQGIQFAILAVTWLVIDTTLMSAYSSVGSKAGRWFQKSTHVRWFNRITGSLFITAGGALLRAQR
ncbi:LysE family translocator [Marinobacter sp. R17]|uniref:LysE family translocator n=1 Tax=Marinobacter sp. R17 TaxID=2484250 RepID=UPI000F4BB6E2|nr:LysE family translocator [Marinobacter sp. R17]ROU00733.1 LysE family translocator [Marinobacter sp. R17]